MLFLVGSPGAGLCSIDENVQTCIKNGLHYIKTLNIKHFKRATSYSSPSTSGAFRHFVPRHLLVTLFL